MILSLRPVQIPDIYKVWDKVQPLLLKAQDKFENPEYTVDHIKVMLTSGQWVLVAVVDEDNEIQGALTISFINYPNDRVAFITAIGGKLIVEEYTANMLADICKAYGATTIHGVVNESIARLYKKVGYKERAIMVERRL